MLYSKRFYADRASLLLIDLGIEEKYRIIIEKHIKFFVNKERTQRFYDLEIENFNEENILIGLMSAVCKVHICSFDEVIRVPPFLRNTLYKTDFLVLVYIPLHWQAQFHQYPLQTRLSDYVSWRGN